MHYGLKLARADIEVAAAFDIDDVANDVYESNFGLRPRQVVCVMLSPSRHDAAAKSRMTWPLSAVQHPGNSEVSAGQAGCRFVDDGAPMPALYSQVGIHPHPSHRPTHWPPFEARSWITGCKQASCE